MNPDYTTQDEIPYGYCHCGCGGLTPLATQTNNKRGVKKGKPQRFIRHHQLHNDPERDFWNYVDRSGGDTSCWNWTGNTNNDGYGNFFSSGKYFSSHRHAWELTYGDIPDGLLVCHNCPEGDNPLCNNPKHLWLGTIQENNADRNRKGRQVRGERHPDSKLTRDKVKEIIHEYAQGRTSHRKLAKKYGVEKSSITRILNGTGWKDI